MKTKSCSLKKAIVTYITVVCFVLGPNIVAIGAAELGPIEGTPQVQMPYLEGAEEANRGLVDAQAELEAYMETGAPEPVLPEGPVEAFMYIPVGEVPVPEIPFPINTTIEESYDESGNLTITTETVEEYDLNGNLIKITKNVYGANGNLFMSSIVEYDEDGNLIIHTTAWYDEDGNLIMHTIASYEYDEDGNLIKETVSEYDINGNLISISISETTPDLDADGNGIPDIDEQEPPEVVLPPEAYEELDADGNGIPDIDEQ